jgi:hypothetical protein
MPLGLDVRNGLAAPQVRSMCNLYSITKNQAAIRDLFKVARDSAGNLPPMPGVSASRRSRTSATRRHRTGAAG